MSDSAVRCRVCVILKCFTLNMSIVCSAHSILHNTHEVVYQAHSELFLKPRDIGNLVFAACENDYL